LSPLQKFARFNRRLSDAAAWLALAAMVFMVVLTCIDVIGAKLFLLPVPGSLDIMQLAQLMAITLAAGMTLIERRHVAVEFFVELLPARVRRAVALMVTLLCLALFVLIVWRLFAYGQDLQAGGEETPTAHIALAPFAYAAAAALLPVCLVLLQQAIGGLLGGPNDEP
jgi:TRAP-type C4-dicarboxylate transport system permease small subunit